ncbi:hypothetical protein GZH47_10775 [Paenibacillus rhizovicinus]|uniref:Gfo/Idh/MocA family oxidoreductase n=1 Tax=Paenibacillus rhizovicinus TaxID=2704463 RepID=A0A6C0P920_9BACL|nr:hypothetical protein [Paenibacillus rhizovicinus]QHW35028.1 hypothetical protein GZH47_10775 [Paenibacillus rhizovicinus]
MKTIGFIDYFLDEWHAEHYPAWIEQASNGGMRVAYAYGKVDKPGGLTNAAWCGKKGIELLASVEEVVAKSDYLVVLSPDHPEFHEELCELPLRSGKPTYVDKTFAPDRRTALALFETARKNGTPLWSASALRFAAEYAEAAGAGGEAGAEERAGAGSGAEDGAGYEPGAEKPGIAVIGSVGPGTYESYAIHQVEPIVMLMGCDARRVMYIGNAASPALLIAYADGRQAEIRHFGWDCPFSLTVQDESGKARLLKPGTDYFQAFIRQLVEFFETGESPVDPAETIAIMTILEYGRKAASRPYEWLELPVVE